jgi:ADP-ribosylation factor-like protein 2
VRSYPSVIPRLTNHSGDVGGQKTLRSYWRNYFEKTDALIWVVDATDRLRIDDCREELHGLLQEEVSLLVHLRNCRQGLANFSQRLSGASLLVFANKTDVTGCMTGDELSEVGFRLHFRLQPVLMVPTTRLCDLPRSAHIDGTSSAAAP